MASELAAPSGSASARALALALALTGGGVAHAQGLAGPAGGLEPAAAPAVYELRLAVDLPLIVASALVGGSWLLRGELAPPCAAGCDPESVPAFDRVAVGRYDTGARMLSDVGVGLVLAGSSALFLAHGGFTDLAVGTEAVLATSALAVITMYAVRRPRPFAYGDEAPRAVRLDGNAALAFPSGHTANAFAATLAAFHMLRLRHPRAAAPWIVLGAGLAASSAVGVSRVLAGDHFPSDVLVGAALGATLGWLVPELHRVAPGVSLGPGGGGATLALSGSF